MASPSLHLLLPLLFAVAPPEGWLGVYLESERDDAVVAEVIPNSPAAKAGLQVGDIVVRLGDTAPVGRDLLRSTLAASKSGDRLTMVVRRGAAEHRVVVRLGDRPDAAAPKPEPTPRPSRPGAPPSPAAEPRSIPTTPANAPAPAATNPPKAATPDVDAELQALRAELEALRRQLEALRKAGGRE